MSRDKAVPIFRCHIWQEKMHTDSYQSGSWIRSCIRIMVGIRFKIPPSQRWASRTHYKCNIAASPTSYVPYFSLPSLFLSFFLPSYLPLFLPFYIPALFPSFLPSYLPSLLSHFPPIFLFSFLTFLPLRWNIYENPRPRFFKSIWGTSVRTGKRDCLSVRLSVCLSVCLPFSQSFSLPPCMCVRPSMYIPTSSSWFYTSVLSVCPSDIDLNTTHTAMQ